MSLSGKYITNLKGNYGSTQSFQAAGRSWLDFIKSHKGEGKSLRELGVMYRNQNSSYKKPSPTMPGGPKMPGKRHRKRKS